MKTRFHSILFLAAALLMCACSKKTDLLHCASGSDMIIASVNLAEIYENAGCTVSETGVQLSDALAKIDRKTSGEIAGIINIPGIDLSEIVLSMPDATTVAISMHVTNQTAFADYLKAKDDIEASDDNGIDEYSAPNFHLFIEDGIATLVSGPGADYSTLRQLQEEARKTPVTDMQRSHLCDGNAANVLFSIKKFYSLLPPEYLDNFVLGKYNREQIEDAYAALAISLSGLKLEGSLAFYDKDNNKIESPDSPGSVDTSLLQYASAADIAAAIVAMPKDFDWSGTFNKITGSSPYRSGLDPMIVEVIAEILGNIDGSIMLAGGPKTALGIQELSGWDAVAAVQFKEGVARDYFEQIKTMATESLSGIATITDATADKFTLSIPNAGTFYVECSGNMLLASLSPIEKSGKCPVKASDFSGCNGALVIELPKDNVFSSLVRFPFGIHAAYTSKGNEINLTIEETETDGLFLDNLIRFVSNF